jgi:hypothetical protein
MGGWLAEGGCNRGHNATGVGRDETKVISTGARRALALSRPLNRPFDTGVRGRSGVETSAFCPDMPAGRVICGH